MKLNIRSVVPVLLISAATIIPISQGTAHADSSCTSNGYLCVWAQTGFSGVKGGPWFGAVGNWPGAGGFEDGGIENNDSSAKNTSSGSDARVYKFQQSGTKLYCVYRGTQLTSLQAAGRTFDNGSSHTWHSTTAC